MIHTKAPLAPALSAFAIAAWIALQPAAAQIPNAPGTPIGTPLGSPGAVEAPQMAQPVPPPGAATAQDTIDPPGRVGRLSEVTGQAWLYSPDTGEWIAAERNRPLTSGDRLATDGDGRVEVRIGSTTLRVDGNTELEVEQLDDARMSLRLHNGSVATRLRSQEVLREFELLTGEGRFTVQRTGRYRFDRNDESSHVTVYAGQAMYEGQGSALTVYAGQRGEFWLDNANVAQYSLTDPVRDDFAAWNSERDRADDRYAAQRYVSPEMTGVEDLDRYGSWQQNPEYGALWVPRVVAPGWAPYTTGRWVWVSPWGWTWVDEAPWGFAPFHYGRWVYVGSSWCWAPGTYVRRPVYAPALVAWIGGPRLSVSLSIGGAPAPAVGWVPLAPREVYVPGYRVSPRYVRNVNVTHVTNITNITTIVNNPQVAVSQQRFANRKFPHAVTVVPADVVAQRRPVAPVARQLRDTPDVRRFVAEPTRTAAITAPPVAAPPTVVRRAAPGGAGAALRAEPIPAPPGRQRLPISNRPNLQNRPNAESPAPGRPPAPAAIAPATPNAAAARPAAPVQPPAAGSQRRPGDDDRGAPPRERGREPDRGGPRGEVAPVVRQAQPVPAPSAQPLPGRVRSFDQAREAQQTRDAQAREAQAREAQAQQAQRARELQAQRAQQQARQAQQAQQAQQLQAQQAQQAQQLQVQQAQQAQQARQARMDEAQRRAAAQAQQQERARAVQEPRRGLPEAPPRAEPQRPRPEAGAPRDGRTVGGSRGRDKE